MFYTSNMVFFPLKQNCLVKYLENNLSFPPLFVLGVSGSAVTTLDRAATFIRYAFSPIPLSRLLCQRDSRGLRGPYRRQKSKHVDNLFITYINSSTSNLLISNLNSFSRSLLAFQRDDSFSSALSNDDGMFQGFFFSKIDENNRLFFFWRFIHSTCPITCSFFEVWVYSQFSNNRTSIHWLRCSSKYRSQKNLPSYDRMR